MIVREDQPESVEYRDGSITRLYYSDAGGLTQFGACVETLEPGGVTSDRHWHENEDEFLYVVSGDVTVIEDDGPHLLVAGDSACWKAGTANAHHVVNRSDAPCSYLIFGTRMSHDTVHYPDIGRTLHNEVGGRSILRDADGAILMEGQGDKLKPLTWEKGYDPKA